MKTTVRKAIINKYTLRSAGYFLSPWFVTLLWNWQLATTLGLPRVAYLPVLCAQVIVRIVALHIAGAVRSGSEDE